MILATAGFLAANSGSLYANDNFPNPKSKKVKQHRRGGTMTKKKEVKNNNNGSSVKKTKKSNSY